MEASTEAARHGAAVKFFSPEFAGTGGAAADASVEMTRCARARAARRGAARPLAGRRARAE